MENSTQQFSDHDVSHSSRRIQAAIWCPVFAMEAVAIVIGNLLTIVVFARDARLRKPSSYFIISLALADLCIGLFTLPLWIYQLTGLGNLWHSVTFLAVDIFTNVASISNLAAISLERLYAIMLPWRHRATSKSQVLFFIVAIWMLSGVISGLYMFAHLVLFSSLGALYSWLPYFCLLLLIICVSYSAVFVKMRRGNQRRLDSERKLTITLFMATAFSLVAHLPMVVLGVLFFALGTRMNDLFLNILSFLNFGNSLVNPLLYSFRMPDFRKAVCSLFCTHHQQLQQAWRSHVATPPVLKGGVSALSFRKRAVLTTTTPSTLDSRRPDAELNEQ